MHLSRPTEVHGGDGHGSIKILASKLFDSHTMELRKNQIITVCEESGLILDVCSFRPQDLTGNLKVDFEGFQVIDLRGSTVIPGFVDVHVHFFLHPYSETAWEDQLTKESLAERTVRATIHAKRTLMAGFTSVRDLGTEGAADADIALRKCISGPNPIIPGPRYFCANRAIVATGSYGPRNSINPHTEGVYGITGADAANGTLECVKAVRRQIGAGADWIKIYADYRFRSQILEVSPAAAQESMRTFDQQELEALITTAHQYGVKVAAHATNSSTVADLVKLQVDTIEHGYNILAETSESRNETLTTLARSNTIWVPTLAAYYVIGQGRGAIWEELVRVFRAALSLGMDNLACGGDTGTFAHGDNALEMKLMVRLGADWRRVLRWATYGGWECVRSARWEGDRGRERLGRVHELGEDRHVVGDNEVPFGALIKGFAADIIAISEDLERDFEKAVSAESIHFVMKGGRVFKHKGKEVG